jgi:hypothetical protein|tara:strand:+ start:1103 stop:1276 length:174 start_codon:yes stop_codon:yes gene_type:complete
MTKTFGVILIICLSFLFTVILFETMVGCGERTYYEDGYWLTNECIFIPYEQSSGRWK